MVESLQLLSTPTTASSGDPLVPELVVGLVATVTITGTTSGKADGTITGAATVGGMGSGATVTLHLLVMLLAVEPLLQVELVTQLVM